MNHLVVLGADRATKGVRVLYPKFTISIQTPAAQIRFGDAINFTINAANTTGKAVSMGMAVKLFKYSQEIETLYSANHDFAKDESFSYSGSYTVPAAIAPGLYSLRQELTGQDGRIKYGYASFSYLRSNVVITLDTIPEAYTINSFKKRYGLIPGQTYSINFK